MSKDIRVLFVEDSEEDMILLIRKLKKGGIEPNYKRVDDAKTLHKYLDEEHWDIVISDYAMPGFSGIAALRIFKEKSLDIPFIIVSGTIGEDVAVSVMKEGAHDYLMKDKLERLVPAIERELREAKIRRGQKQAEKVQAAIYQIAEATMTTDDLQNLFQSIHQIISSLMPVNNFYISLYDHKSKTITFPYYIDQYDKAPEPLRIGKGITSYVIKTGQSLLATTDQIQQLISSKKINIVGELPVTWLGIPLIVKNNTIGVMAVQSYEEGIQYGEQEKDILTFVSTQIAMAIERKRTENALRDSEDRYRVFLNQTNEGIYRLELEEPIPLDLPVEDQLNLVMTHAYYAECNISMAKMYGYKNTDKIAGMKLSEFHKQTHGEDNTGGIRKCIESGYYVFDQESKETDKDGKLKHFSNNTIGIIENNHVVRIWGTQLDITKRKKAEDQIKKDLKEKEVMLKEIHHRVKNNLQIISSMLNLQSRQIQDEHTQKLFKESQNRIYSMALVHETLYSSPDLASIDFSKYVKKLISALFRVYTKDAEKISLTQKVEKIKISVDLAIPCGLIINELVSNSLKYAFPDSFTDKKRISIQLKEIKENEIELIVKDNGIGLPEEIDIYDTETLGLRLITILIEDQLMGKIQLTRTKGTAFIITFNTAQDYESNE